MAQHCRECQEEGSDEGQDASDFTEHLMERCVSTEMRYTGHVSIRGTVTFRPAVHALGSCTVYMKIMRLPGAQPGNGVGTAKGGLGVESTPR